MHGLEAEFDGQIDFVYLDIDDPATAYFKRELNYRYQPHLFLMDGDGDVVTQWVGLVSLEELRGALQAAIDS